MATKANIVQMYAESTPDKRIDIICKNYHNFEAIIKGKISALMFSIEEEKEFNRREGRGDLGIRVKTSGYHSDVTWDTGVNETLLEKAIIKCDFSGGILDGTDDEDKHIRDACTLNRMRREYNLFNSQMGYLSSPQKKLLLEYLTREKSIEDLAEQEGIQYRSVQKKISEIKMIVKKATVNAMERGDL